MADKGRIASLRGDVPAFEATRVLAAANALEAAGRDIVHLEVGQPAGGAPAAALAAARDALGRNALGYTESLGIPDLRQAIAALYQRRYGLALDPRRVVVTTGSSGGFLLAFLAMFDAGARVGVVEPGYPAYRNMLGALDLVPVGIPVGADTRFNPTPGHLAALGHLEGLLVASPANPTGSMLDAAELSALIAAARDRGIRLISDEIYHGIGYGMPAVTALSVDDDVVVISGFSKYFGMTGWRIGWMVVPERLVDVVDRLAQNFFISAPSPAQIAARAALDATDELDARVAGYAANRELLVRELPRLGFRDVLVPDGAFYIYASLPAGETSSEAYCARLLNERGVAVTPGIDFDPVRGHGTLRFSFAGAHERMAEAVRRLAAAV
jgi:aspartate/methionine/tyrosine aminotransferase